MTSRSQWSNLSFPSSSPPDQHAHPNYHSAGVAVFARNDAGRWGRRYKTSKYWPIPVPCSSSDGAISCTSYAVSSSLCGFLAEFLAGANRRCTVQGALTKIPCPKSKQFWKGQNRCRGAEPSGGEGHWKRSSSSSSKGFLVSKTLSTFLL